MIQDSPYGVTYGCNHNSSPANPGNVIHQLVDDVAAMVPQGGGWIRFQQHLYKTTSSLGVWDFTLLDDFVSYANKKNVNICMPLQVQNAGHSYLQTLDACFNTVAAGSPTALYIDPAGTLWSSVVNHIVKQYNGSKLSPTTNQPMVVQCWQIANEEFDTFTQSGCNRDYQGNFAGITLAAVVPLITAAHPGAIICAPACRRTPSNGKHVVNWFANMCTKAGAAMNQVTAVDYHYYRDDPTSPSNDPSVSVVGGGTNQYPDIPSEALELQMISGVVRGSGYGGVGGFGYTGMQIWNGEVGWHLYSGTQGGAACCASANCATESGVNCCAPVSETTYANYMAAQNNKSVYDMLRQGGGDKVFVYSLDPEATVNSNYNNSLCPDVTVASSLPQSITQKIAGTYTYTAVYTKIQNYASTYPVWGAAPQTDTRDANVRLRFGKPRNTSLRLRFGNVDARDTHMRLNFGTGLGSKDTSLRLSLALPASGSLADLGTYKTQIVQVYNASGQFLDVWRDAPLLAGFKEAMNDGTSSLLVKLPRSFDNYDLAGQPGSRGTIAQGNVVQYWLFGPGLPATGLLRYQGVIDAFQPQIADNGEESLLVTLTPFSSVIADHGLGGSVMFGQPGVPSSYVDPLVMLTYWFTSIDFVTGKPYTAPLTLSGSSLTGPQSSSGVLAQYTFTNQTLQSIWNTVLLMLPANYFYRINADKTVTIAQTPTIAQHTFVVGQHMSAPTYKNDWTPLKNFIYYKGGPVAPNSTASLIATAEGSDIATFGERLQLVNDTRVLDQNSLNILAQGVLTSLDRVLIRTQVRLVDYRGGQSGLGYDIETLKVGDSCVILDPTYGLINTHPTALWGSAKWDTDYWAGTGTVALNTVVTIASLTYNFDYVDLELTNFQPNQALELVRLRRQFQDYTMGR